MTCVSSQWESDRRVPFVRTDERKLSVMYWQMGKRSHKDILKKEWAEYGKEILSTRSTELTTEYGRGFGRRNLQQMVRIGELYGNERIAPTLSAQWSRRQFTEHIRLARERQARAGTRWLTDDNSEGRTP